MIVSVCEFMGVPFSEQGRSSLGIVGTHPGSFRKSGKQRSCRIRNLEEDTEHGRGGKRGKDGSSKAYGIGGGAVDNSRPMLA